MHVLFLNLHFRGERGRHSRECKFESKAHRTFDIINTSTPVFVPAIHFIFIYFLLGTFSSFQFWFKSGVPPPYLWLSSSPLSRNFIGLAGGNAAPSFPWLIYITAFPLPPSPSKPFLMQKQKEEGSETSCFFYSFPLEATKIHHRTIVVGDSDNFINKEFCDGIQ